MKRDDPANEETVREASATRRQFLATGSLGLGAAALGSLLDPRLLFGGGTASPDGAAPLLAAPHFPPRARRVIYLFQSGGPSQLDLFDYKPLLRTMNGQELPDSVRMGQRLTGMTANQRSFPLAGAQFEFARHGRSGAWLSELLPHTAKIVDELCFVRSLHTEAINHDPAMTFFQTGSQHGRPAAHRGLAVLRPRQREPRPAGVRRADLSRSAKATSRSTPGCGAAASCPRSTRACSSAAGSDPVLYLDNPDGPRPREPAADARHAARARTSCSALE